MFRKLVAATVAVAAVWPVAAQAANHGFYASIDAGAVDQQISGPFTALPLGGLLGLDAVPLPDQSPGIGWAVFGAAGMRLDGPFRVEGEIGYRASTLSSVSDIDHLTVMANVLYDFAVSDRLSLSIGGGIGVDRIFWNGDLWGSNWVSRFAAQGIAGASFKIAPHASIDLKYRYLVPSGVELTNLVVIKNGASYEFTATDLQTHTVSLGLTFDLD